MPMNIYSQGKEERNKMSFSVDLRANSGTIPKIIFAEWTHITQFEK